MHIINGGITTPKGFSAAGIACGIKANKKDLALIYSECDCVSAAVFTTNRVKAAPVLWNQNLIAGGEPIRCILINSGNANACTGEEGLANTEKMAEELAASLQIDKTGVMVNSTGVIGVPLPMDKITKGIQTIATCLGSDEKSADDAAHAILTTDTCTKTICVQTEISGKTVTIAAIAKGSGMIHPNMATMLSHIVTDANISQATLRVLLKESIADSYHMLSVDGDTSTNDTVIVLANGMAGNETLTMDSAEYAKFAKAFHYVNKEMAKMIAHDGEGATKLLFVRVSQAQTKQDAKNIAMSVVQSSLVKTAVFGQDANWGRVLCAMGYADAAFDPNKAVLFFENNAGSVLLYEKGLPTAFSEEEALRILSEKEIVIRIELHDGDYAAEAFGCDLSYDYVRINGEYRS
jgi:glutamate N-acetyltransferase/amino-acid N-acetyltransferase